MTKVILRGRPQKYPLTAAQIKKINSLLAKGQSTATIAETLGTHTNAVLRIRRGGTR